MGYMEGDIMKDECEQCHRIKEGRWIDDDDGSGEWFLCYDCHPRTEEEAS